MDLHDDGDRVNAGGGRDAYVTVRTRFGWVMFRQCCELPYGKIFPLRLKGAVYDSCILYNVLYCILYAGEKLCMKESEMAIFQVTKGSMVRAMCGLQLKGIKRSAYLMFMLGLNETTDQLAMANSVC